MSKIGEYMYRLLSASSGDGVIAHGCNLVSHVSTPFVLQPELVECLLSLVIYSVKNIDHVLFLFPGKNINQLCRRVGKSPSQTKTPQPFNRHIKKTL